MCSSGAEANENALKMASFHTGKEKIIAFKNSFHVAVLEILEKENLIENAATLEGYFKEKANEIPAIKKIKGRGLMLGLEFDFEVAQLRKDLIYKQHIFTGGSANKKLLRFLPALNITKTHIDQFFKNNGRQCCGYAGIRW